MEEAFFFCFFGRSRRWPRRDRGKAFGWFDPRGYPLRWPSSQAAGKDPADTASGIETLP